uniref:Exonuclease n=1 Tax=Florenciella sp. virus SA2 TaxID=3240092 RepID=A0AB39J7I3_9VIRU
MIHNISNDDISQLKESITNVINDLIHNIDILHYHDSKFEEFFKAEVYQSFSEIEYSLFENIYDSHKESIMKSQNIVWRSYKFNLHEFDYLEYKNKNQIEYLKQCYQPEQKSEEWLKFRKMHLTGSNSWKIFGTESSKKQLLYEKLEPYVEKNSVNLNDMNPMNWGHKYEPISVSLYEYYNDVKVEDFGCIEHSSIPYLAASPDGIVTSKKNNGRMLEIKNPTTREITQIPKMDYYIQMQLQMEVCDLDECDFVETKFTEYDNYNDFKKDKYKLEKGMIIVLIKNNSSLIYEYSPLFCNKEKELDNFTNEIYKKYNFTDDKLEYNDYKWFKNIYWKLDIFSCVYVPRNKEWFEKAKIQIEAFWQKITEEQKDPNSYLKFKPKQRQMSSPIVNLLNDNNIDNDVIVL